MMRKHTTLLFTLTGASCCLSLNAQVREKPNIIWLMAEDMGQDLECYGMQAVRTPVLNKMASEGVKYNNAYCSNPISSPSRSAMMTGMHQNTIQAHNHRSNRELALPEDVKPITYYLRRVGYTCILGNTNVRGKGRKIDCNFKHDPIGSYDGINNFGLFDKFDEFSRGDQPFFAQIQLNVTHRGDWWKKVTSESKHPVNPDKVVLPLYMPDHPKIRQQWAAYLDQVEYMDYEVGKILEELERKNLIDNTIIFFIADNGRCEVRGKGYLYEPGVRIPMIVWGKGIHSNEVDEIVSTLDISATILGLAGAELPAHIMGEQLFEKKTTPREYFYAARDDWDEIKECMRAVYTKEYAYIKNYMPHFPWDQHQVYLDFHRPAIHIMRMLRAENKLNSNTSIFMSEHKPQEELYDMKNDPYQLKNLAYDSVYRNILQDMRNKMNEWQNRYKDNGLEDIHRRKSVGERVTMRDWVKKHYPKEWQKLLKGEICDKYSVWAKQKKDSPN